MKSQISFANKKILFITTKNLDYIRNSQEISLIKEQADMVRVLGSNDSTYMVRLLKIYVQLLFVACGKYDMVFIGFAPQLIVPLFFWKFRKTELVIDFFISIYDTMVFDRKKFSKTGLMGKVCRWVDLITIKKADYVISDTNAHGDYFSEEFDVERSKINTLYLEADKSIYFPMNIEKSDELKNKFVVLYFGSILPLQGVEIILETIEKLKQYPNIHFLLIGPMRKKYACPEGENVEYYDWLSQRELAKKIAGADLCLAGHFHPDIAKARRTIPGKAYIYHAMQKKMILGENLANRELFAEDDEKVFYVEMGSSLKLSNKILEIMKNNKDKDGVMKK